MHAKTYVLAVGKYDLSGQRTLVGISSACGLDGSVCALRFTDGVGRDRSFVLYGLTDGTDFLPGATKPTSYLEVEKKRAVPQSQIDSAKMLMFLDGSVLVDEELLSGGKTNRERLQNAGNLAPELYREMHRMYLRMTL